MCYQVVAVRMQDYETAAQALQLASSDFKAERAWKHHAGAQVHSSTPRLHFRWQLQNYFRNSVFRIALITVCQAAT
jgi:ER-Golgi trafficking TRAPP I complex 85 kDa subunit